MAKQKGNEGTVTGYFRTIFAERPDWLGEKSNDPILARYREDHNIAPGGEIDKKIKQNLANIKSVLRKQSRKKKRGRPKKDAAVLSAVYVAAAAPIAAKKTAVSKLDTLEESIDDCLTAAKSLDREELHDVIVLLRKARNAVVWKIGQ
jgi:two-component sensor histidine kinase